MPIPRPVANETGKIYRHHQSELFPIPSLPVINPFHRPFINFEYENCSGNNWYHISNFVAVAIKCFPVTVDRGGILTRVHRKSMVARWLNLHDPTNHQHYTWRCPHTFRGWDINGYSDDNVWPHVYTARSFRLLNYPDSKVHVANMGPTWGR